MKVRRMVLDAVLLSATVVIGIVESFIPSFTIPGIKLGLANIMILVTLYEVGILDALIIDIARVFLVSLLRGNIFTMPFFMSLSGAMLSFIAMLLLYLLVRKFSILGVSVVGSLFHVFGQIIIAMIFLGSAYVVLYLPIIAISAIVTGIFVGLVSSLIIRTSIIRKQRERYKF